MVENIDLAAAKPNAPAKVLVILNERRLDIPDNDPLTIERNTTLIVNWVFNDQFLPLFRKFIGWSEKTFEMGLWPGNPIAKKMADKLELISKGLTQTKGPSMSFYPEFILILS